MDDHQTTGHDDYRGREHAVACGMCPPGPRNSTWNTSGLCDRHQAPAPLTRAQLTLEALYALAKEGVQDKTATVIVAALLPTLRPGERARLWSRITLAESARHHLACGDIGWGPGRNTPRRPWEDDDRHLTRALADAEAEIRFACRVAVVADTVSGASVPAQRVDA